MAPGEILVGLRAPALFVVPIRRYNVGTVRKLAGNVPMTYGCTEGRFCSSLSVLSKENRWVTGSGISGGELNKDGG